jgi:hypothetical protein
VDLRHQWFQEGAHAFRSVQQRHGRGHLLPPDIDAYPCPLCLQRLFAIQAIDSGELTREHAPPQSLGGGWLALTCRTCNNDAGRFFDGEAERQERLRSFLTGQHQGPVRGTYTVNGVSHRGDIYLHPGSGSGPSPITFVDAGAVNVGDPVVIGSTDTGFGMYFQGVERVNNPPEARRFEQALGDAIENRKPVSLSISPKFRFSPERALVSWIRTAYLVAFAALGWSYVLHPTLTQVRDQFQARENACFPPIELYDTTADPNRNHLMIITTPVGCESLLVVVGSHLLFLPWPGTPRTLDDLADAIQVHSQQALRSHSLITFDEPLIPWPTKPEYRTDYGPADLAPR